MKISKKNIFKQLHQVLDPELNISIVDLGLIYNVLIHSSKKVKILMTFTTIGCPLMGTIEEEIKNKMEEIGIRKENIEIDITFDPPWTMDKMSPRAKSKLGI